MNANQEVERTLACQASEWVTVLGRTAVRILASYNPRATRQLS